MTLLPPDKCAAHISKLLDAANEAGLCCPRSIDSESVRRFILREVPLAVVMKIDSGTIDRSISHWMSVRRQGQRWAPWHLGDVLAEERDQRVADRKAADRQIVADSPIQPTMIQTQEEKDQQQALAMVKAATMAEKLEMVRWAQRQTGRSRVGFTAAHLIRIKFNRQGDVK